MIISHSRKFILFTDPLGAGEQVQSLLAPFGDAEIGATPRNRECNPFFHGMTPLEAEWAFDAAGYAFHTYLRLSTIEDPFSRLARLYDRIAQTDTVWQLRHLAGIGAPSFSHWLRSTHADGLGAGHRNSPIWRQRGSWSGKAWECGRINHTIRTEEIEEDIVPVLGALGIAPALEITKQDEMIRDVWRQRYDPHAIEFMAQRYCWDLAQYGYSTPRQRKAA